LKTIVSVCLFVHILFNITNYAPVSCNIINNKVVSNGIFSNGGHSNIGLMLARNVRQATGCNANADCGKGPKYICVGGKCQNNLAGRG
jgi:hypothetical protein